MDKSFILNLSQQQTLHINYCVMHQQSTIIVQSKKTRFFKLIFKRDRPARLDWAESGIIGKAHGKYIPRYIF
jgi:hypothetical protein